MADVERAGPALEVMMASNKKADERHTEPAIAALKAFYGGARSAVQSPFGAQLEAVRTKVQLSHSSDADAAERRLAKQAGRGQSDERVSCALGLLTPKYQETLRDAYDERHVHMRAGEQQASSRPGISRVVRKTAEAARAVSAALGRSATQIEIDDAVARAPLETGWLKRAQVAATLLTQAATAAFVDEWHMVGEEQRNSGRRDLLPGFWGWKDSNR